MEGLERLVVSAQCDASKWGGGKYKWIYHFDSKARGVEYLKEKYPELAGKITVLVLGNYMANWKENLHFRKVGKTTPHLVFGILIPQ